MEKHKRVYYQYFGYSPGDFIPCEITGLKMNDIHHIDARGMGGSDQKDYIENLMGVTRRAHVFFGDKEQWVEFLVQAHLSFMNTKTPWAELYPKDRRIYLLYDKDYNFSMEKFG